MFTILLISFATSSIFISPSFTDTTQIDNGLEVQEFLLCKDVLEREPVDVVRSFRESDERGWVFARLSNSEELTHVHFVWYFEDELYFEIRMRVGVSPAWRTYSSIALQAGAWRVVLQDKSRNTLREIRFHVDE